MALTEKEEEMGSQDAKMTVFHVQDVLLLKQAREEHQHADQMAVMEELPDLGITTEMPEPKEMESLFQVVGEETEEQKVIKTTIAPLFPIQ